MSLPMADKMAKKLGVSRRREVETLVIHGTTTRPTTARCWPSRPPSNGNCWNPNRCR
jgi:hypothetical protein